MTSIIDVFLDGGGVQSTAALVLAGQGLLDCKTFVFCNVGTDSENPKTIAYLNEVQKPYAASHGLEIIEVQKTRFGKPESIYERLTRPGSKSVPIPVRLASGAPGRRVCTVDFKVEVSDKWIKKHVLFGNDKGSVTVGLGISMDEFTRMRRDDPAKPWKHVVYPLIDMRIDRARCISIIEAAGLPIPPKSSCWFCPYHRLRVWQEMRHSEPELFWKAVALEAFINMRRRLDGKGEVFLTDKRKPLHQVTTDLRQDSLFAEQTSNDEQDLCELGYCMV